MPTTVTRYVDPNSTAGGDGTVQTLTGGTRAYVSLNAWEAARQADIVAADTIERAVCSSNLDAAGGSEDTTATTIDGWTTDATRYVVVQANTEHNGVWNDDIYRITSSATSPLYHMEVGQIIGIQAKRTGTPDAGSHVIGLLPYENGTSLVDRCLGVNESMMSGMVFAGSHNTYQTQITEFRNCIGIDTQAAVPVFKTIYGICKWHNCTAYGGLVGFERTDGTATAKNCGAAPTDASAHPAWS